MNTRLSVARSLDGLSEPGSPFERLVRLLRADVEVLKGLTWRRTTYTFLVAAGFALWTASGNWIRLRYGSNPEAVGVSRFFLDDEFGWLLNLRVNLLILFSQMLALTAADNLHISRVPQPVMLLAAFVLGTTVGSAAVATSGNYGDDWPLAWGLVWGGLVAIIYFKRRRDMELAAALHAVQLARVELQRKRLESDLQLMQAQVEPQFLFNTLRRVGDLYDTDRRSADRMLDNLILYLRAALPQMRTSSSTLGHEVRLTQAYLNIERIRLHDKVDFAFDVPEALTSAMFPPMVLLPLIEALAVHAQSNPDYCGAMSAWARADAGKLELTLAHTGDSRPSIDECENVRGRLSALYGGEGKLEIEPLKPRGTIARLSVPYVQS